jgi:hypothetical protein
MKRILFVLVLLAGCGSESENVFNPAAFCNNNDRGGVAFEEGGYVYCNNGEFIQIP